MFAGIEDEHLGNASREKEPSNEYFDKGNKLLEDCKDGKCNTELFSNEVCSTSIKNKSLLPTKAAMKSTVSFCTSKSIENNGCDLKSFQNLRTMPLRRRLSNEIDAEMLKFPVENNIKGSSEVGEKIIQDSNTITKKTSSTYKVKKINRKNCQEYKYNNRSKKTKFDLPTTTKQKLKQRKFQRLLPSDHDEELEEKNQQHREIDNKNRSPFILVNSNGGVTVVNTLTQDDFNEKYTRTRKLNNYVYERKTVKGCHSSTLSNRYDADTADSSWICVFCKNGPHKKGLGDLFGPYIISTECDEYQSYKNFVDFLPKNRRSDVSFLTGLSSNGLSPHNKLVIYTFNIYQFNFCYHTIYIYTEVP